MSPSAIRQDNRKRYPTGTRGSAEINAEILEPQTAARGEEFHKIVGDTLVEARAMVEERLRAAGFTAARVKIRDTDLAYWWDADIVEERG